MQNGDETNDQMSERSGTAGLPLPLSDSWEYECLATRKGSEWKDEVGAQSMSRGISYSVQVIPLSVHCFISNTIDLDVYEDVLQKKAWH